MEGALPSVVGGYVSCPVIGVPTSVGYGANFGGVSALLSMLNSCANNVAVVNIDAGFQSWFFGRADREPFESICVATAVHDNRVVGIHTTKNETRRFALADPTRRGLLARLAQGDATVSELAAPYDMSLAAISKHLKVLEGAGLVSRGPRGRNGARAISKPRALKDAWAWLDDYRRFWDRSLDQLGPPSRGDETGRARNARPLNS